MVIKMDLNKLSCKEFGVVGENPLQELKNFFSLLHLKTKQQTFPIDRDSEKTRSVPWTLIRRCRFKVLPHLPAQHPITIKTESPPTICGGKARGRRLTDLLIN